MRRAAKVDDNQREIVAALRRAGATVRDLSRVGEGCPDLLVGFRGRNWLVEVKRPKATGQRAGRTTPAQDEFLAGWRGHAVVVWTVEEALQAIGALAS